MRGLEQIPLLYDAGLALLERGGLGRWRAWLTGGARGRTLDLGAGTGRNLPRLPPGTAAVAVDPHRANLIAARRRAPHVPAVLARGEALPFKAGAFETVLIVAPRVETPHPVAPQRPGVTCRGFVAPLLVR